MAYVAHNSIDCRGYEAILGWEDARHESLLLILVDLEDLTEADFASGNMRNIRARCNLLG